MIAVTGATGKTGADVSAALQARGHEHVALSRTAGADSRVFDWADSSTWASALEGVDAIFIVKPPHGTDMPGLVSALLDSNRGIRRAVLLSEMNRETKQPADPDRAVELVLEAWDGEWTILRPSWFFQNFAPRGDYFNDVRVGFVSIPTGEAPISWIDTRDVADSAVAALVDSTHAGEAYTLTGEESFGVAEVARRLTVALGRPVWSAWRTAPGLLDVVIAKTSPYQAYLSDLLRDVLDGAFAATSGQTRAVTGHAPRRFDDFVAEHLDTWRWP